MELSATIGDLLEKPNTWSFKKLPGCCQAQFAVMDKRAATSVY
jgi:hypothetical protein